MGPVARVVYLADKLDPAKVKRHPALEEVEALANEDIDRALIRCLDHRIGVLIAKRRSIHPASVDFRNELLDGGAGPRLDWHSPPGVLPTSRGSGLAPLPGGPDHHALVNHLAYVLLPDSVQEGDTRALAGREDSGARGLHVLREGSFRPGVVAQ